MKKHGAYGESSAEVAWCHCKTGIDLVHMDILAAVLGQPCWPKAAAARVLWCLLHTLSVPPAEGCLDPTTHSLDAFLDPRGWCTHAESAGAQPRRG